MEDDPLQTIIEIQGQIIAMRRGAAAFPDPKLQAAYFHIADLIEHFVRELDRATAETALLSLRYADDRGAVHS